MASDFMPQRYKGWTITGKGHNGMYSASHPDRWRVLQADTLDGMKRLITKYS